MIVLPVSLTAAAAAALINLWLAIRIGRIRTSEKILMGDGANASLVAAMRAQANFVEYTPFVLVLLALIELASGTSIWLGLIAAVYLLGRLAHGIGMMQTYPSRFRMIGTIVTFMTLIGLAIAAVAIAYLSEGMVTMSEIVPAE
ncbi:MAG: MAPEG family protein [Sphingomonadaceae bacterium]